MISPHPTTTQLVAEAARRERLERLAEAHRYPGPIDMIWARFKAGPVIRWFEIGSRRFKTSTVPAGKPEPIATDVPAATLTDS